MRYLIVPSCCKLLWTRSELYVLYHVVSILPVFIGFAILISPLGKFFKCVCSWVTSNTAIIGFDNENLVHCSVRYVTFKTFPKTLKLNAALDDHTMIWHQKQRWGLKVGSLVNTCKNDAAVCMSIEMFGPIKKKNNQRTDTHFHVQLVSNIEKKIFCKINLNLAPWNFAFRSYSKEPVPFIKLIINVSLS